MKKRYLLRTIGIVLWLAGLSAVQALAVKRPIKAWQTFPIIETGFSTAGIPLVLKDKPLFPERFRIVGLTSVHFQLSSSISLKFDYRAMEHRKIKHLTPSVQRKGVRLGLLMLF